MDGKAKAGSGEQFIGEAGLLGGDSEDGSRNTLGQSQHSFSQGSSVLISDVLVGESFWGQNLVLDQAGVSHSSPQHIFHMLSIGIRRGMGPY